MLESIIMETKQNKNMIDLQDYKTDTIYTWRKKGKQKFYSMFHFEEVW